MKPSATEAKKHTFQDYLDQLLGDIDTCTLKAEDYFSKFSVSHNSTSVKGAYHCDSEHLLSEIFPITKACLPEVKLLSDKEASVFAFKIERMWNAYHFFADFPNLLPDREKYRLMRSMWDQKVKLAISGESHIEFCHSEPACCPFDGFCTICGDLKDE